jgi:nucleoside-diphosphate-sugar epimerase
MSEPYFITGAQGCIGAWVVKALVDRGDTPVVFDRSTDARRLAAIMTPDQMERVKFLAGDITDADAVRRALNESHASRIIHLAGLQVPACKADPVAGATVNVVGTLNIFEAARLVGLTGVVYASSAAVLGPADSLEPVDESAQCEPTTHYGVFKRANEGSARVYFLDFGISSVGLRPLTVYGVGRDTGLTSDPTRAIKAALLGRKFHIRFSGNTDFLYVADAASAFIACADRPPEDARVFNLHGDVVEVRDIVRLIDSELPLHQRGLITFGGPLIPVAPSMNDRAIRAAIGNVSKTPLNAGIRETIQRFSSLRDEGRLDTGDLEEVA